MHGPYLQAELIAAAVGAKTKEMRRGLAIVGSGAIACALLVAFAFVRSERAELAAWQRLAAQKDRQIATQAAVIDAQTVQLLQEADEERGGAVGAAVGQAAAHGSQTADSPLKRANARYYTACEPGALTLGDAVTVSRVNSEGVSFSFLRVLSKWLDCQQAGAAPDGAAIG